ncbi:SPOR domain-containing protein [Thalassospiraceae bacterium LMO-JJ14]|nr:SPOR domain-containing protein [Thalassospiraceae bacterium LMO-JJ14]
MALSANSDMKVSSPEPEVEGDGDTARTGSGATLKVLGALVGLTLIAGGVWIGFGERIVMMMSPDDGDVPVLAADPSPIKVRPENPGGMQVPNQGRLVYGVVDGTSTQPRVERLLPSPEKPVAVDEVLKRGVPETSEVVTGTAPRGTADMNSSAPVRLTPTESTQPPLSAVPSAADVAKLQPTAPPPPPPAGQTASAAQPAQTAPPPAAPPVPRAPAVSAAPKPAPKAPSAPAQTATATPVPESPASDITQSYRIQLAASRSEDAVKSEWDRLRRRHVDLLGELRLQVMRIDLGATRGVFYRLRAGPLADAAAAKTLCERLKQRKLGCLVVKPGA